MVTSKKEKHSNKIRKRKQSDKSEKPFLRKARKWGNKQISIEDSNQNSAPPTPPPLKFKVPYRLFISAYTKLSA